VEGSPDLAEADEIEAAVERGWRPHGQALTRELEFRDFEEAMGFAEEIGEKAVDYLRRPDISIKSNRVSLTVENLHHAGFTKAEMRLIAKASDVIDQRQAG
jgi:pterin-4a-carbinolamine dehydratase